MALPQKFATDSNHCIDTSQLLGLSKTMSSTGLVTITFLRRDQTTSGMGPVFVFPDVVARDAFYDLVIAKL